MNQQTASPLSQKECKPCQEKTEPLKGDALQKISRQIGDSWKVVNEHHLEKEFSLKDFRQALDFTIRVGEIAETENHHPDIYLTWGKVKLTIWTHNIDGLSENDFILAAKVDEEG